MVLRLVVNPHVVGDVGGGQQLPADVTGNLLLVPDQVGAEAVPRGEGRRAGLREENSASQRDQPRVLRHSDRLTYRALEGPLGGVHLSDVAVQVIGSGGGGRKGGRR